MTDFATQAATIVTIQRGALAAYNARGASLHGWSGKGEPPVVETVDAVVSRLIDEEAARVRYNASAVGRFVGAAMTIFNATGDDRLIACHSRGLETNMDFAAALLAEMEGPAADQARFALEDIQRAAA